MKLRTERAEFDVWMLSVASMNPVTIREIDWYLRKKLSREQEEFWRWMFFQHGNSDSFRYLSFSRKEPLSEYSLNKGKVLFCSNPKGVDSIASSILLPEAEKWSVSKTDLEKFRVQNRDNLLPVLAADMGFRECYIGASSEEYEREIPSIPGRYFVPFGLTYEFICKWRSYSGAFIDSVLKYMTRKEVVKFVIEKGRFGEVQSCEEVEKGWCGECPKCGLMYLVLKAIGESPVKRGVPAPSEKFWNKWDRVLATCLESFKTNVRGYEEPDRIFFDTRVVLELATDLSISPGDRL